LLIMTAIGPALRNVPVARLGISAHTASRLIQIRPDEANTGGQEHPGATDGGCQ
jgi:hypothetical protein